MARPPCAAENEAYAVAVRLAGQIAEECPGVADRLGELLDAVKIEQRLATQRGRPIYTAGEEVVGTIETWLRMGPKGPGSRRAGGNVDRSTDTM